MADKVSNQAKSQQSATATAEDILTIFKRRGLFDSLRKSLFADFKENSTHESLIAAIESLVESDSSAISLATRSRGKAAALLEGSVNRSEAFGNVNKFIDDHVSTRNDDLRNKLEDMVQQIYSELKVATETSTEPQKDATKSETNGKSSPSGNEY
ncbi:complex proteins associated with Set1p component shg1-domain-containing protein [Lipomyces orientalis]|uniref:Complex proteins associated with Set1p component shg1-domain-containing protein n=1 Tax=Lipomyces orientalis TaxID=1233043 RepID=A0ACC3TYX0_9ASCO